MDLTIVFNKLMEQGVVGIFAVLLLYFLGKEREKSDGLQRQITELQEKRIQEARQDTMRVTEALTSATDATERNADTLSAIQQTLNAAIGRKVG